MHAVASTHATQTLHSPERVGVDTDPAQPRKGGGGGGGRGGGRGGGAGRGVGLNSHMQMKGQSYICKSRSAHDALEQKLAATWARGKHAQVRQQPTMTLSWQSTSAGFCLQRHASCLRLAVQCATLHIGNSWGNSEWLCTVPL